MSKATAIPPESSDHEEKWNLARGDKYKGVIIVGEDYNGAFDQESLRVYREASSRGYLVIGDTSRSMDLDEIKTALDGHIDDQTRIDILAHGGVVSGRHQIDHPTHKVLSIINECSPTPKHIHLHSCHGGFAARDISVLEPGSFLACHASEDNVRFGTLPNIITKLLVLSPMLSASEIMLHFFNYEISNDASFAYKRPDGSIHIEKFRIDLGQIIASENTVTLVENAFKNFFDRLGEDLPENIFGRMPQELKDGSSILSYLNPDVVSAQKLLSESIKKTLENGLFYLQRTAQLERFISTLGPKEIKSLDNIISVIPFLFPYKISKSISHDSRNIVKWLVEVGFNIHASLPGSGTALEQATRHGDLKALKSIIEAGVDINLPYDNGDSPLLYAVRWEYLSIIEALIEAGADINFYNSLSDDSPLSFAILIDNIKVIAKIIEAKADTSHLDSTKKQQLFSRFIENGLRGAAEQILPGAELNFNLPDDAGLTPLKKAIDKEDRIIIEALIKFGADIKLIPPNDYPKFIFLLAKDGPNPILDHLIEDGLDINCVDEGELNALAIAFQNNSIDAVKNLIKLGLNPNSQASDGNPLLVATLSRIAKDGFSEASSSMFNLLIESGADLNVTDKDGKSCFDLAIENNQLDMAVKLLEKGLDMPTCEGLKRQELLLKAIEHGFNNAIEKLLPGTELNLNLNDIDAPSPLKMAIDKERKDIIEIFIKAGANVRSLDSTDNPKLIFLLAKDGPNPLLDHLISEGLDIDDTDENGLNTVDIAIEECHPRIIPELIRLGINPSSRLASGESILITILSELVEHQHSDLHNLLVNTLILSGADVNALDKKGKCCLAYALEMEEPDISEKLLEKGASIKLIAPKDHPKLLFQLIQNGPTPSVDRLIREGLDIHSLNEEGQNAITVAIDQCCPRAVYHLVRLGLSPDSLSPFGVPILVSAMMGISRENLSDAVRELPSFLIESGANVNAVDHQGKSCLAYAVENNRIDIAAKLIEKGAFVNNPLPNGESLLYVAIKSKNKEMVKLLLENKHKVDIETKGTTILKTAMDSGRQDIIKLVVEHYLLHHELHEDKKHRAQTKDVQKPDKSKERHKGR